MKDEMFYSINWKYRKGYDDAMADKWIPVRERVPEENEKILITVLFKDTGERKVIDARYIDRKFYDSILDTPVSELTIREVEVTAWMPDIKPYQEDDNEKAQH